MMQDKQLRKINVRAVRLKQRMAQALNAKEFAVLAGLSYSVAREWFHLTGFPAVRGMIFWEDFVLWRRSQNKSKLLQPPPVVLERGQVEMPAASRNPSQSKRNWPGRAAQILSEA